MANLLKNTLPIMRALAVSLTALLTIHCCLAESPKQLKMAIYRCPPGFFIKSGDPDKGINRNPIDGINIVEPSPFYGSGRVYDVQGFFKSQGIVSSEGSQAFLIENEGVLFVKDSAENIDLIETLGFGYPMEVPMLLRNELFVVQFNSLSRNPDRPVPTFSELRRAAGDSWKQICALEVFSKSGQSTKVGNSTGIIPQQKTDDSSLQAPEMQSSDDGISCALETVLGPDAYTIDSTISFRFQSHKNANGVPKTITYSGSSTFWDGQMQVLQFYDGSDTGTAYALLMRITVAGPNSIPIKTMSKTPELPENK